MIFHSFTTLEQLKITLQKPFNLNDYFIFAEILKQTNFLKSQKYVEDPSMIANRSGHYLDMKIKERKFYLCTDLKFDFEAQKWTDDKMG